MADGRAPARHRQEAEVEIVPLPGPLAAKPKAVKAFGEWLENTYGVQRASLSKYGYAMQPAEQR